MVGTSRIDLHTLNLDELVGVVNLYFHGLLVLRFIFIIVGLVVILLIRM